MSFSAVLRNDSSSCLQPRRLWEPGSNYLTQCAPGWVNLSRHQFLICKMGWQPPLLRIAGRIKEVKMWKAWSQCVLKHTDPLNIGYGSLLFEASLP